MEMTKEQAEAISSREPLICVDAAAGSGKTHILVERITDLLERDNVRLDQIVAITFMEKAAAEMKARLRARFRKLALDKADEPERARRWRELARGVDGARVSTIHGFCLSVLRENALRLGADPDAAMLGDGEGDLARQQAVTDTLHGMLEEGDEHAVRLVVGQGAAAVSQALGEMLRCRGAFEALCAALPVDDPAALLAEWRERCDAEFDRRLRDLHRSWRLQGLLARLRVLDGCCYDPEEKREWLRRNAIATLTKISAGGLGPDAVRQALEGLFPPGLKNANAKPWCDRESFEKAAKALGKLGDFVESTLKPFFAESDQVDTDAARLAVDFAAVARRAIAAYDGVKAEMGTMDFDDLISRAHAALRDNAELRGRVALGMRHLLVDEFQDTDGVQFGVADLLRAHPGGPALFVVGDPKQSIYLFRGADVRLLCEVRGQAGEGSLTLPKNFRSLPDVLEFVNELFAKSGSLAAVERYKCIEIHRPSLNDRPRVEIYVAPMGEDGKAPKAGGQAQLEAQYAAARIREMVEGGHPLAVDESGVPRPVGYGDIAMLFRKAGQIHVYEEELRRAGIPYCRAAGEGFYERQEVMDVLHLLKAVTDPWNEPALLAFLRGPMACLSDDEIVRLRMAGGVARAFHAGVVPAGFPRAERLLAARKLLADLHGLADLPCGAFLRRALEKTRFEAVLLGQYHGLQKASNLRKLVAAADAFARRGTAGLRGFIQYVDDVRGGAAREGDANLQAEGGDAVVLLTVHKAKGLEFPVVFVAGMGAGTGGSNRSALFMHTELGFALKPEDDENGRKQGCCMAMAVADRAAREQQDEEARTLYVALTRARDYLVLMGQPEPDDKTWFSMVDRVFGVTGRKDGAALEGGGWQGVVRRTPPDAPAAKAASATDKNPDIERLRLRIAPVSAAGAPERRVFSVTEVLNRIFGDGADDSAARTGAEEDREGRAFAMARGTLVHRLFEEWDFTAEAPPDMDELVREARLGLAHRDRLRGELQEMAQRFRGSELERRMAADPELKREEPFLLAVDGAVIRGTIDALLGDGTVLDYKTGMPHQETRERYALQLALYAAAVRRLLGRETREGLLYYPDHGDLVPVPLGAPAVESALSRAEAAIRELRGMAQAQTRD